jgi:ribose transport system permease protein
MLYRLVSDYGIVFALLALGAFFSLATIREQPLTGAPGGDNLAGEIVARTKPGASVLVVVRDSEEDNAFAEALAHRLTLENRTVLAVVRGSPGDLRAALAKLNQAATPVDGIAAASTTANWPLLQDIAGAFPSLGPVRVFQPSSYVWPDFLKAGNLLNIVNQIVVIALIAIGMTMVIIAGGIDLSVGSLVALSAVTATLLIRDVFGGESASAPGMVVSCLAAVALCGLVGFLTGTLTTWFQIPPFIATLGMMLVASGAAFKLANDQTIYEVPASFIWLGRGVVFGFVPNSAILMAVLYLLAHLVMTRTTLGRYVYAVGNNVMACHYAGVPVRRVLIEVYVISGVFAGLGGVVLASQLKSGSPKYGQMYELYVIAAVVVGGTSLSGGRGQVFGTLLGAFLIAVIQNGMNLTGIESNTQRIVLGALILVAVLLDTSRKKLFARLLSASRS